MEEKIVIKSEKISQKKKKKIVLAITVLLLLATIISFSIDYIGYRKGQKFGLASAMLATKWVDEDDSYADQCHSVYRNLDRHSNDFTIGGVKYDMSDVRKSESEVRETFAELMKEAGYDRYSQYSISSWFEFTNPVEYYIGAYGFYNLKVLPVCLYAAILFSIIFLWLVGREEQKEILVYEDSVLCKTNQKKAKQIVFEDISNIDFAKNSLQILGTGVKYKISHITNAESIKAFIIEKKKAAQSKPIDMNLNAVQNSADELKKYKGLLDSGVITQEEFDAKKKQILGL